MLVAVRSKVAPHEQVAVFGVVLSESAFLRYPAVPVAAVALVGRLWREHEGRLALR